MKQKIGYIMLILLLVTLLAGCKAEKTDTEKIRDLEFTVVEQEHIPEELLSVIEEKKSGEFKITYRNDDYLYIVRGYGEQHTGGYSIAVNECYLSSNAIYLKTNLIGPDKTKDIPEALSYPYVVIKLEDMDKNVVFQ